MVKEFPYALECKLIQQVELGQHTMFIGEIVGMVADEEVLSPNQLPDIEKVRPMLFGSFGSMGYYSVGARLGDVFSVGNVLR
jgi:flavin reductase (DIM6/NTAB) family NADH-FMN oxidoreductase RutF